MILKTGQCTVENCENNFHNGSKYIPYWKNKQHIVLATKAKASHKLLTKFIPHVMPFSHKNESIRKPFWEREFIYE